MTPVVIVIGLMVVGLALLAIEILVIPGVGLIGGLGGLSVAAACYVAVTELDPGYAAVAIAGGVVAAGVLFWLFPRTRAARAMVLETQTLGGAADPALKHLAGLEGVAITPLRPSGSVEIDGRPVDVVSDGQYVDTDTRVRVTLVEGSRVVVEPIVTTNDN